MEIKLTIERCRELIEDQQNYFDKQLEEIRGKAYLFADLVVSYYRKLIAIFTKSIQKVSAKASIVKPKDLL